MFDHYDNLSFLEDLNASLNENEMGSFCFLNDLTRLIHQPTRYKSSDESTCIDLILTIRSNYFRHNNVLEAGLSKFHMMVATGFEMGFQKMKPHCGLQ